MKPRSLLWIIIALLLVALFVDTPKLPNIVVPHTPIKMNLPQNGFPIKLGLDLQGGTELVLQTDMSKIAEDQRDNALESARQVIERRVNAFGVSESSVVSAKVGGDRRILVDLPGVSDASAAADLVGKTAQLDFRDQPASYSAQEQDLIKQGYPEAYFYQPTGLTGADLKSAQVVYNQTSGGINAGPQVSIQFNSEGAQKFADITKRDIGKPLAIFLDNQLVTAPTVSTPILDGNGVISGQFTTDQANNLAIQLNAGALPVPVKILYQRSISAQLGAESVQKSLVAGIIGLSIVILYMAFYYGLLGLLADAALLIYALLTLAIFKTGLFILPPITLSLAGIAGFVLSVGMAVDANILIFERMKEERRWGKAPKQVLELGFSRAWSSIRDSNFSTLITCFILYQFLSGTFKGFPVTLAIGVLVSMFTAVVVTRTFLRLVTR